MGDFIWEKLSAILQATRPKLKISLFDYSLQVDSDKLWLKSISEIVYEGTIHLGGVI